MRFRLLPTTALIASAFAAWSCGGGNMPSSPSTLPASSLTAPGADGARIRPLEDPPPPSAEPTPDPAPPATPLQVIINIIGSFGAAAFNPNPIAANVGDTIVWTNSDTVLHHIVLDDGTDLGDVAPGQSSAPIALATPTAGFHCTLHPSMVGSINGAPAPPPVYIPTLPPDDYYGYY